MLEGGGSEALVCVCLTSARIKVAAHLCVCMYASVTTGAIPARLEYVS